MAPALNGGTAAPRGRRRPPAPARPLGPLPVNPRGRGLMNPAGEGPDSPAGFAPRGRASTGRGRVGNPQAAGGQGKPLGQGMGGKGATAGKVGVGGAALPGPGGRQLAARVSSGKITQEQADRTMKQRQTLQKAFGSDWRSKLQVGGQSFAQVNKGLSASPSNPKLAALRKKLLSNRKALLTQAQSKGKKPKASPADTLGE